jgi:hypothetical protein
MTMRWPNHARLSFAEATAREAASGGVTLLFQSLDGCRR